MGRNVYITQKESDAIQAAIDFIYSNIDGANEEIYNHYDEINGLLNYLWAKANPDTRGGYRILKKNQPKGGDKC